MFLSNILFTSDWETDEKNLCKNVWKCAPIIPIFLSHWATAGGKYVCFFQNYIKAEYNNDYIRGRILCDSSVNDVYGTSVE